MESLLSLLLLYLVAALVIFPIWAFIKLRGLGADRTLLQNQLRLLEEELQQLRADLKKSAVPAVPSAPGTTAPTALVQPLPAASPIASPVSPLPAPVVMKPAPAPAPVVPAAPPPLPAATAAVGAQPSVSSSPAPVVKGAAATPPVYVPPPAPRPAINWELFMGVKLFAWVGGLALFLAVAFFVKYSFEHDLIPPEVRVAIGFAMGTGLIVGGLKLGARYRVVAQALIATGVVSLYAVTFACNSVYHFAFFGMIPTFLLMALITTAAFVLAVRLRAQVVALLGMLGGFLTPVLLSTGHDNPGGLFGYLALLDVGLVAVALRARWFHLVPIGAAGTVIMMVGWAEKFFTSAKTPIAMVICLGFSLLYLAAAELARRRQVANTAFSWTAAALPLVGFGFAFYFLGYRWSAVAVPQYLGYVLALDLLLIVLAWRDELLPRIHLVGGMTAFLVLAAWTTGRLESEMLPWALGAYLAFACLHTAFPQLLERHRPESSPTWWSQFFPPLTILLLLLPIYRFDELSILVWPALLLIDVLAIALAVVSGSLAAVGAVLVLTLVATGMCIFKVPVGAPVDSSLLLIIGGFAVFFFGAAIWLGRKIGAQIPEDTSVRVNAVLGGARSQLPAFSSLLPFLLLIMVCGRLPVPNPSMVFGLALLLSVLTLGLSRVMSLNWLPLCALAGTAALEFVWHDRHFSPDAATLPLFWYLGFHALFTIFPFLFQRTFVGMTGPWATSALSGILHFPLIYDLIDKAAPNETMGMLPAVFAVPPLLSLVAIVKTTPPGPARLNQLAWFGGIALFFITLIFPIQFERQWITIGWALEGAALLWLFHRVPHPALRALGVILLAVCFVRLAGNKAVLGYHPRSGTAIWNWYLYTYGIVTLALFAGARLLAPPRERVFGLNMQPFLNGLGVVLAFLLLNIEIADYFASPGDATLTFQFSGNFARDMTYTIAWALFALGLLGAGIWRQLKPARYAAIGLLCVALLKLFLHDLANLAQLYRIAALFAVAVIAIIASFAYQRFLPTHEKAVPPSA